MRIMDKNNSLNEIVDTVLQKARYQKVVICIDEHSNLKLIEELEKRLRKQAVLIKYYYNNYSVADFFNILNSGVRVVIYNVSAEHFCKLKNDNNFILNIFIAQSNCVAPYIDCVESAYGDNFLLCNTEEKDYVSIVLMYERALNNLWQRLIQNADVDTRMFKDIDALINGENAFYENLINMSTKLKSGVEAGEMIGESDMVCCTYLRLEAIYQMLISVNNNDIQYIDFYKSKFSSDEIDKAHALICKHNIIELIKVNCVNLIKINSAILNRVKIIIKKHFNLKNINYKKINKTIKEYAKTLNIDNLLYISYIFNTI